MKIIIDGPPISQARMRLFVRNGASCVFDPRTKQKNEIKKQIKASFSHSLFERPRVSFIFHMPIPKSIPKCQLLKYNGGFLKHEKKPDIDNLIKLYLDCIDGICFEGDQKVQLGPCVKLYHIHPKTIIIINETEEFISPLEVGEMWPLLTKSGRLSSSETVCLDDFYSRDCLESSQFPHMSYQRLDIPASIQSPLVRSSPVPIPLS